MTRLKTTVLITATLLILASIIVNQRANFLMYSMTSSELPELLEPKDEGEEVRSFKIMDKIFSLVEFEGEKLGVIN